jgi:DHA2 family multidrug resistance protein
LNVAEVGAAPARERLAYKWKVLIAVLFGIFMVILDTTVVAVAFPALRAEFARPLQDTQWIISIYVLALGISTPMAGFLSDRYGLKRVYVFGLAVFLAGSVASGLSPTLEALIASRALQGIGGGLALPLGAALMFRTFPPSEQGTALGVFGVALVVAPTLGPLVGGWLVDRELWRWIFFINLPIGLVGIALARRFLADPEGRRPVRMDLAGLVTEVIGFGAVLYAASIAATHGWRSSEVVTALAIGIAGLVAFTYVELYHAAHPLLNLRLFKDRVFAVANLIGWVSVLALFGAEFLMPLYLQSLRGFEALQTGLILLPLAVTAGITLPIAGRIYDRIGPRPLLVLGFGLLAINTWHLAHLTADTTVGRIVWLLALRGLALGLTVQTTFATALARVPIAEIARGTSLANATRQVVQAISVALLATVLVSTLSPSVRAAAARSEGTAPGGLCGPIRATSEAADRLCAESLAGFDRAYALTAVFAVTALVLGATLPGWPGRWTGRPAPPTGDH